LQNLPSTTAAAPPTCEQSETNFIYNYLKKYNSPLANIASFIVTYSDNMGIDDRFIVALAGAESIYGKTQQSSPTWAYFNVFSNAAHCQALAPNSDCYAINPYSNYGQATTDAINLLTGSKYFGSGLNTVGAIYQLYNRIPSGQFLATIYAQLVPNATVSNAVDFHDTHHRPLWARNERSGRDAPLLTSHCPASTYLRCGFRKRDIVCSAACWRGRGHS
jgi:hypothetical protein